MRNPSTGKSVLAVLAVLALAAGAGAFAGADLGGGPGVIEPPETDGSGNHSGDDDKPLVGSTGGGGGGSLSVGGLTARSLLGLIAVPLSPAVVAGLAVLVGLAAVALGRREATTEPVTGTDDDDPPAASVEGGRRQVGAPTPDEENAVYRAWERLAERAGGDVTLTPRERAGRAVTQGFDRDRIAELRRLFEEVRYGERTVTEEVAERARAAAPGVDGDRP